MAKNFVIFYLFAIFSHIFGLGFNEAQGVEYGKGRFFTAYEIGEKKLDEQVVICMYFIFTSLNTFRYGDYLIKNS